MGKRRALAGGVVVVTAALGLVVPRTVAARDGQRSTVPALPADVVAAPAAAPVATLPSPPASVTAPVCLPSQLHVTQQDFKVAVGTVVGTYGVETDGCSLSINDTDALKTIDGGAPPLDAVMRAPGVVDITFRNPNVQGLPPTPPLPALPPLRVPPATVPTLPPTTLPNVAALAPVTSALSQTLNSVQNLISPTTTAPPPPPPPPPPPDNGPTTYPPGSTGFDISWPQCGHDYPPAASVAVVGVNDGRPFSDNPCLQSEAAWAAGGRELYMNLSSPAGIDTGNSDGPAGHCGDAHCLAYNYGWNAAVSSYDVSARQGVRAKTWWLDVEVVGKCAPQFPTAGKGYWSCDQGLNMATVQGALDALRQRQLVAGIYSTSYQYGQITGGATPAGSGPPNWLAGASPSNPAGWCSGSHNFAGGPAWLLQFSPQPWDRDQAC